MNKQESPLMGPKNDRHESRLEPANVCLSDNSPLYFAFLSDPNAVTLSTAEVQEAKTRLSGIIARYPEVVLSCEGRDLPEAKRILEGAEAVRFEQTA